MQLRKILLRVMIWSLAVAAVLGALAILTSGSDIIWRIAATTGVTAACAAILMAASLLLNKDTGRASGLVGMWATLVAALLTLALIWELDDLLPSPHTEESTALTLGFLALCTIPAMGFLRARHSPPLRIASIVGVILTVLTFCLFMLPAWFLHNVFAIGTADIWYGTASATGLLGLLLVGCLVSIDDTKSPLGKAALLIRIAGAAAAAVAWVMAVSAIWMKIVESSGLFVALISTACVISLANLALLATLTPGQRWVRIGTIAAAIATAVCVDYIAFTGWNNADEFIFRIGGAAGFVTACGSLALIILSRMNRPIALATREYREAREIVLTCPGCRSKQTLPTGDSSCPTCHLRFTIRIEEPRCVQCDYLLFMLSGDKCPECGTPFGSTPAHVAPPTPAG